VSSLLLLHLLLIEELIKRCEEKERCNPPLNNPNDRSDKQTITKEKVIITELYLSLSHTELYLLKNTFENALLLQFGSLD
jgi:hypothetical protein